MKNLFRNAILLVMATFSHHLLAQTTPMLPSQLEAMNKMHVMVGNWTGEGWMQQGQSERKLFTVEENVQVKNNGVTLLVEGLGKNTTSNEIVHDALAVLYFDASSNQYKFDSHLAKGMHQLAIGNMNDNIFTWGFDLPNNAKIRYTLTFTESTWNEIGEYSPDDTNWYKFLEMNLIKTAK